MLKTKEIKKKQSFTLLEVIISLAITVVITAILLLTLNQSLDLWQQGNTTSKSIQQSDITLHWIENDLKSLKTLDFAGEKRLVLTDSHGAQIEYYYTGSKILRMYKGVTGPVTTDTVLSNVAYFRFTYRKNLNQVIPNEILYPATGIPEVDCYMVNLVGVALTVLRNDVEFDVWTSVKLSYRKTAPVRNVSTNPITYYMTIQDALNDPNLNDGHVIQVSGGTYTSSETNEIAINKSVSIKGGYSNPEWIQDLTDIANQTIIDAQGSERTVWVTNNHDYILLEGFKFINTQRAVFVNYFNSDGSGLFIQKCIFNDMDIGVQILKSGKVNVIENIFTSSNFGISIGGDNYPDKEILISGNIFGGSAGQGNKNAGIEMKSKDNIGKVTISDNTFSYNGSPTMQSAGGAVMMQLRNQGTIKINNNLFAYNLFKNRKYGTNYFPGGAAAISLFCEPPVYFGSPYDSQPFSGKLTIESNIIRNNETKTYFTGAGGIFIDRNLSTEISIDNNLIENNVLRVHSPADFAAAAIAIRQFSEPSFLHYIKHNKIQYNTTDFDCTGIYIGDMLADARIFFSFNILKNNHTTSGTATTNSEPAAIRINSSGTGNTLEVVNNLIFNNYSDIASKPAGGIWVDNSKDLDIINNTLTGNQFGFGCQTITPLPYFKYNISWGNGSDDFDVIGSSIESEANYYRDPETSADLPNKDIISMDDPFEDAASENYLLKNGALCIDINPSSMMHEAVPPGKGSTKYDAGVYGGNYNDQPIGNRTNPIGPQI
ncbi:MAG: prepilin-type N-terminal cleavage/methylation domain-containing protein [Candidatus Omnitrophica bacterium]|nr:prepilin-type N-terminal cleavage/methylation domain-containing protein [Candidatus Omnitrophota bacterium]